MMVRIFYCFSQETILHISGLSIGNFKGSRLKFAPLEWQQVGKEALNLGFHINVVSEKNVNT